MGDRPDLTLLDDGEVAAWVEEAGGEIGTDDASWLAMEAELARRFFAAVKAGRITCVDGRWYLLRDERGRLWLDWPPLDEVDPELAAYCEAQDRRSQG